MKKQNKITAIIPARLSSSRLVEKHLYKANHKTMINHLVDRLKSIKVLDDIILATTTNSVDDLLVNEAIKLKINYFRGSEENVKQRVLLAGKKYSVDIICFITGDCPLIDPILIEQLIYTWLLIHPTILQTTLPLTKQEAVTWSHEYLMTTILLELS